MKIEQGIPEPDSNVFIILLLAVLRPVKMTETGMEFVENSLLFFPEFDRKS
jgi:hypothetical protein